AALIADNPTNLFVTLAHGVYDPGDGSLAFSAAGHPPPELRRVGGTVEPVRVARTMMLGNELLPFVPRDTQLTLAPGETFILYSDGLTEAHDPTGKDQFGTERLRAALGGERSNLELSACAEATFAAVARFHGGPEQEDDQTLLLLRRGDGAAV